MTTTRLRINALTKKRSHSIAPTGCTMCGDELDTNAAFKDSTGKLWCLDHEKRGKLLDYAVKYGYPAIRFVGAVKQHYPVPGLAPYVGPTKYAIGIEGDSYNKYLWLYNAFNGTDDLINGAIVYLGLSNIGDSGDVSDDEALESEEETV